MVIHDCKQYSIEWWQIRCGIPSASNFKKILTSTGAVSKQAVGYIDELIADRISGLPCDTGAYQSPAMENGSSYEKYARQCYREKYADMLAEDVTEAGFITDDKGLLGCSPDLLVLRNGKPQRGAEIKCPLVKTHLKYLREGVLPPEYLPQVHGSMVVTGLDRWDFMSYVVDDLPPLVVTVERDDYTEKLRESLYKFADQYADEWDRVQETLLQPVVSTDVPDETDTPF